MNKEEALYIITELLNNKLVATKAEHIRAERALQVLKDEAED